MQRAQLADLGGVARGGVVAALRGRQRSGGRVLPVCPDGGGGDGLAFVEEDLHLLADEALGGAAADLHVPALDVDVVEDHRTAAAAVQQLFDRLGVGGDTWRGAL